MGNPGYDVTLRRDYLSDGAACWLSSHPELSGCQTDGASIQDAVTMLDDARDKMLEVMAEYNVPIPKPHPHYVLVTIDFGENSLATRTLGTYG